MHGQRMNSFTNFSLYYLRAIETFSLFALIGQPDDLLFYSYAEEEFDCEIELTNNPWYYFKTRVVSGLSLSMRTDPQNIMYHMLDRRVDLSAKESGINLPQASAPQPAKIPEVPLGKLSFTSRLVMVIRGKSDTQSSSNKFTASHSKIIEAT